MNSNDLRETFCLVPVRPVFVATGEVLLQDSSEMRFGLRQREQHRPSALCAAITAGIANVEFSQKLTIIEASGFEPRSVSRRTLAQQEKLKKRRDMNGPKHLQAGEIARA